MNLNFIKLDINILNDTKIKILRKYPDGDKLIVLWIGLLCLAMKSDTSGYIYITQGIPYTAKDLANEFDLEEKTVQMGLELFRQYRMIDLMDGGVIEVINFNKHQRLDKIEKSKELSRETSRRYRERQKMLLSDNDVTISDNTDIDIETDKDIEKKEKEKEKKDIYGKLENVKLTDKEFNSLLSEYGEIITNKYINRLSLYDKMEKYKSHYRTILNWIDKDNIKPNQFTSTGEYKHEEDGVF